MEKEMPEHRLQEYIVKAQQGDTEAFAHIYDQFFAPVYRYTAFRLPPEVAEDVVSDIFVKSWEKLHTYKPHKGVPFAAWIFRIARHSVIDAYRTQRGFEEVSESLPDTDALNRPESRIQRNETLQMVRSAISRLPSRYRDIITLLYIGDLPIPEVARVLRITQGGVRILKMRALRKLEALLPPDSRNGV